MASLFGLQKRDVVRIKVKKCEGYAQPEYKKLCVDPQLTSYDILRNLLARAFSTYNNDFTISYLARDDWGHEIYISLLSDWDLDAAFLSASDPFLRLKIDLKPFDDGLDDWDIVAHNDANSSRSSFMTIDRGILGHISSISSQVGKTVSQVSKAIGLKIDDNCSPFQLVKAPLSDSEFHNFLDSTGHLLRPHEFRMCVYQGGVEASLRPVVWRHLLNIYPDGFSGKERFEYMKEKCKEYYILRDKWRKPFTDGKCSEDIRSVTNMVKKDVLRTDRTHEFYAGSDDNINIALLFNILVTYAVCHPDVSYCQGMSDIASPILVVQKDEATSYICFCGLMKRVKPNFLIDGVSMTQRFEQLSLLLQHQDIAFYDYLWRQDAHDLFFCYRWLLLELKREFPFEDALLMLEIMWSSLPPNTPEKTLQLAMPSYHTKQTFCSPQSPNSSNNAYLKLKAMRRQSSVISMHSNKKLIDNSATHMSKSMPVNNNNAITPLENKVLDPTEFEIVSDVTTIDAFNRSTLIDRSLEESVLQKDDFINSCEANTPKDEIRTNGENLLHYTNGVNSFDMREVNKISRKSVDLGDFNDSFNDSFAALRRLAGLDSNFDSNSHKHKDFYSENNFNPSKHLGRHSTRDDCSKMVNSNSSDKNTFSNISKSLIDITKTSDEDSKSEDSSDKLFNELSQSPRRPSDITLKDTCIPNNNNSHILDAHGASNRNQGIERTLSMKPPSQLSSCEEAVESPNFPIAIPKVLPPLPSPHEFGSGNPFLMFLCVTLLLQQRDHIMRNHMDYNELAMHFDKMIRSHDVSKVLHQAQSMFAVYLKSQHQLYKNSSSSTEESQDEQYSWFLDIWKRR